MEDRTQGVAPLVAEVPMVEPEVIKQMRCLAARRWGSKRIAKELGVTTMLLAALMVLQLTVTLFASQITNFLTQVFGVSPANVPTIVAICSAIFLRSSRLSAWPLRKAITCPLT